jgi:hypothetical protein
MTFRLPPSALQKECQRVTHFVAYNAFPNGPKFRFPTLPTFPTLPGMMMRLHRDNRNRNANICSPLRSNNPSRRAPKIKDGGATWNCQHPRGQHVICGISREQSRNNTTYNMIIDSAICHHER